MSEGDHKSSHKTPVGGNVLAESEHEPDEAAALETESPRVTAARSDKTSQTHPLRVDEIRNVRRGGLGLSI